MKMKKDCKFWVGLILIISSICSGTALANGKKINGVSGAKSIAIAPNGYRHVVVEIDNDYWYVRKFDNKWKDIKKDYYENKRQYLSSIAIDSKGRSYIVNGDNRIYVFDTRGVLRGYLSEGEIDGLTDITVAQNSIYVAKSNGDIYVFNEDLEWIKELKVKVTEIPEEIASKVPSYRENFPNIIGIAVNKEGDVYVLDYKNCCIHICDKDGNYLKTFGCYGTNNGELIDPRDIALDEQGNIYVADHYNKRVQVFNGDLKFICATKSGGLCCPSSLSIDNLNNKVYVVDKWGTIYEFNSMTAGDLDGNGVITEEDVIAAQKNGIGADVTGDNKVGVSDINWIRKKSRCLDYE